MPAKRNASPKESSSAAAIGFEAKLWLAADKLRNNMDAAEYPAKELMAAFTAKVALLYAQITANLHQSRTLATLRDTLLPQLLSGSLQINYQTDQRHD